MTVVYLDRVVLLNLAVDYLLLLATARLAGLPLRRRRLGLCAALGAAYAAAVFLPGCRELAHPLCRLAAGTAMCRLAWRRERRPWRLTALFFLLSGALAGLLLAMGLAAGSPEALLSRVYHADVSWPVLLGSAIGFGLLLHLVFRQGARHEGGELMDVTVSLQGRRQRLRALHDTGNTLRDPSAASRCWCWSRTPSGSCGRRRRRGSWKCACRRRRRWPGSTGWTALAGGACCPSAPWARRRACCWPSAATM